MTFTENIIKLTDYPFLYSIATLLLTTTHDNILGLDASRLFLLLGVLGIIGTILTILDPVGWIIRAWHIHWKGRISHERFMSTNWISYQIDKIVSMIYFSLVLLIFIIIFNPEFYTSYLNPGAKIDLYYCLTVISLSSSLVFLIYKIGGSISNLENQLIVINTYFIVTKHIDEYEKYDVKELSSLKDLTTAMFTALNNRDWGTAALLADKDGIKRIMKKYDLPE